MVDGEGGSSEGCLKWDLSPVHTSANMERIQQFVQLCCKFTRVNAFTP